MSYRVKKGRLNCVTKFCLGSQQAAISGTAWSAYCRFRSMVRWIQISFVLDCCSKMYCIGCAFAVTKREREESLKPTCPFCRQSTKKVDAKKLTKRIQANDPVAFSKMGKRCYHEGDYKGALKYLTKAAELGAVDAHFHLSLWYQAGGRGVEKDKKRELYHTEEAVIGGHPGARHNLGCLELRTGRVQRAVKHFIIAANLGLDVSIKELKECYTKRYVSKEDFAAALRHTRPP